LAFTGEISDARAKRAIINATYRLVATARLAVAQPSIAGPKATRPHHHYLSRVLANARSVAMNRVSMGAMSRSGVTGACPVWAPRAAA
jgi:hypothetical protein